jgi:hypothetical protein
VAEVIKDGTTVEMEMTMPSQITKTEPARVRCAGRIQRCELKEYTQASVATEISWYQFLPRGG